ncbi:MAG: LuxR C-terminal-related transcriptional regulator [Candidatus Eremiobacteraeota bacterium]|nr:LuxR C-terminal-related transcriptional regulator [Candidatus Eremiobacteraeota bacterium]
MLDEARDHSVARNLRIVGDSGVGKSVFGAAIGEIAAATAWVFALAGAHRIQANLPFVLARRTADAVLLALGSDAARYTSGIEWELGTPQNGSKSTPAAIESGLFHLLDAVLLDRPVLVMVDDMQWSDPESRALLRKLGETFADRRFVLSTIERTDELSESIDPEDDVILLGELDPASTKQLARELFPGASESIIAAVAMHARGRAIDLVAIANAVTNPSTLTPEDVAATVRSTISKSLSLLKAPVREFLQMCALIGDPIEYSILNALWSEQSLVSHIEATSGRYLVQREDGLHFVHSTVAQSVRETVPIEIPFRKRIIKALGELPVLTIGQYEQLAAQAAACGDGTLERHYLLRLADEAQKVRALALVARALSRAIPLTSASSTESTGLHLRLAMTYLALNRELDTIAVSSAALEQAAAAGVKDGLGQLVSSLLFALWHSGDRDDFNRNYDRYNDYLTSPEDRAQLLSVRLYADYADYDRQTFGKDLDAFRSLHVSSALLDARTVAFEGMFHARDGDYDLAERALNRARSFDPASLPMRTMLDTFAATCAFHQFGPGHENVRRLTAMLPKQDTVRVSIDAMELMAVGTPQDALDVVAEALLFEDGRFARRVLLGIAGAAAILGHIPFPNQLQKLLDAEADLALRGLRANALAPVASVAAYLMADSDRPRALQLIDRACEIGRRFVEPQIFWMPSILALSAERAKHEAALRLIGNGELSADPSPWCQFQAQLSRSFAARALKNTLEPSELSAIRTASTLLGSPFFVEAAPRLPLEPARTSGSLPANGGVKLTRREREVVEMIAAGSSNREIAMALVLSERTVEGHVANIFGKLDVGSRSQIAAWHVRTAMATPR